VDGYGIRTTVFLKGCPLRCLWCCNPEGQRSIPELKYEEELCNGCGRCLSLCPVDAIRMVSDGDTAHVVIDRKICTDCLKCIGGCFTGALDQFGKWYTVDELFRIVRSDLPFYRASNGGVTIGGGEASMQAEFTRAFIRKCRENRIHTALDTCGYTPTPESFACMEEADLLLFDIKGLDPAAHLANTGVSNDMILANFKRMDEIGKPMIVRFPLIHGYTETDESVERIADLIAGMRHVERVDLIAHHEYGKNKYPQLGMEYTMASPEYTDEQLLRIKQEFSRRGIKVQLGG
jgi:pyruvate formate lyase activating enzyme